MHGVRVVYIHMFIGAIFDQTQHVGDLSGTLSTRTSLTYTPDPDVVIAPHVHARVVPSLGHYQCSPIIILVVYQYFAGRSINVTQIRLQYQAYSALLLIDIALGSLG